MTDKERHQMFSESPNITEHTLAYKRGCDTLKILKKDIFNDYNIKAVLVDFGFAPCEYKQLCRTFQILRLETIAQKVLLDLRDSPTLINEFDSRFLKMIKDDACEYPIIGYKSIAAYRCGFIKLQNEYSETELYASVANYIKSGCNRLEDPVIIKHILDLTFTNSTLPVQFHTGFGDADLDLVAANPLHLTPIIKKYPNVPVVLLHTSWPYCREAGYLASIFSNVYVDTGLAIPHLSKKGQINAINSLMELAPLNKIMYSSDAHTRIEMFGICVEQSREVLSECFQGNEEYLPQKMSINFSTHSAELQQAYNSILDQANPTNWAMFSYGHGQELKVTGTGDGGLEELKDEFEGSKIQYAFARVFEQLSGLPKFVLISWCGEGVPVARKGFFNIHVNDVAQYFKGFHVHINARSEDDVEPAFIMGKVRDSSGAKYSVQGNVANPSVNKPPPKTPAFVPPKTNSYTPQSFTPKPTPVQPVKPPVASVPYTSAPVKPAPVAPAPVKPPTTDESPKALYESVGSTYQPIKTDPKPLSSRFGETFNQPAATQPAPPVTSSVASKVANFSQPPVTSSYQPIKLAPKPLYDEGTAKVAYTPPTQPVEGRLSVQRQQEEKLALQRQQEERLAHQRQQEEEEAQLKRQHEEERRKANENREQQRLQEQREQQRLQEQRLQEQREQQRRAEQQKQEEQRVAQQEEDRKVQERINNLRVDDTPSAGLQAVALYDYTPDESNEIPLAEGEIIKNILEIDEGWWQGTNSHGQTGLFPANYVEVTQAAPQPVSLPPREPEHVPAPAPPPVQAVPAQKQAIALYDYDAAEPNELTFVTDDVITNIEFVSDDWWMGTCKGSTGLCKYSLTLVPANYVELQ
ncbi:hypothetical protein HDV04_000018 [Boothiomyces sp. JEL0838]|nr:hypothetical protein HDV04_000018 [Boothiomyces sp. JEL0838]